MKSVLSILLVVSLLILTQSLNEKFNKKVKVNDSMNLLQVSKELSKKQFTGVPPPKDSPTATPATNYGYTSTTSDYNTLKGEASANLSAGNRESSSGQYLNSWAIFIMLLFISVLI